MKVKEAIELLKELPPEAELVRRDPEDDSLLEVAEFFDTDAQFYFKLTKDRRGYRQKLATSHVIIVE